MYVYNHSRNFVTFVGSLIFMIRLTWKLSTITLTGIPVITMATHYFGNKFKVWLLRNVHNASC